jgi:mono/diheme cytochrome c family protein
LNVARVHNALSREHPDRTAESKPVSLWVTLGAIAVTALGFTFYGAQRGTGSGDVLNYNKFGASYQPVTPEALVPETGGATLNLAAIGEKVYKGKGCVACHQANGLGQAGLYPPLAASEWVVGSTERLAALVAIMPAHAPPILSPKEFAGVLSYIRQGWGNTASEISVESVNEFFARTKGRTAMYTEAELLAIPESTMLVGAAAPAADAAAAPATPPAP